MDAEHNLDCESLDPQQTGDQNIDSEVEMLILRTGLRILYDRALNRDEIAYEQLLEISRL